MRDLKRDLEICNAATPGPWEFDDDGIIFRRNERGSIDILFSRWADGNWNQGKKADWKLAAEARQGWPEAIKRAIAAEARVKELAEALRDVLDNDVCDSRKHEARTRAEELLRELEREGRAWTSGSLLAS